MRPGVPGGVPGKGGNILLLLEKLAAPIRKIKAEAGAQEVLGLVCTTFGFRRAFWVEYSPDFKTVAHLIDTDAERRPTLTAHFKTNGLTRNVERLKQVLSDGRGVLVDASRLLPDDPLIPFMRECDLIDGYKVPITQGEDVAGQFFFSGDAPLDDQAETALLLLCYSLFAQVRSLRAPADDRPIFRLTPREGEVMGLSAVGLTSAEIALRLDISARTVNQHVDNVAAKLGTRNRAHTVAELIRRGMLREAS